MATDLEAALANHYPNPGTLLLGDKLYGVVLRGEDIGNVMGAEFSEAVTKAAYECSITEVSKFTLDVEDPGLNLLRSGAFVERMPLGYADLDFEIASIETTEGGAGLGGLSITAYGRGAQRLKRWTGPFAMHNVGPATFVGRLCEDVGLHFVGQASAPRPTIARLAGARPESSWDTDQRLAKEEGFICFEASGLMIFGQPTWIIEQAPAFDVGWDVEFKGSTAWPPGTYMCLKVPQCRRSENAAEGASVTLTLAPGLGRTVRPGQALRLWGVPGFEAKYIVSRVSADLATDAPVSVDAITPVNPAPEPPEPDNDHDETNAPEASKAPSGAPATTRGPAPATSANPGWRWPVQGKISSGFGQRNGRLHAGLDIAAPTGTRITAAKPGKVITAGWVSGYGNAVYIDHGGGYVSRYGHMSKITTARGRNVGGGELIGLVGSTGNSTGPHLHFEVRKGGSAIDPRKVLP